MSEGEVTLKKPMKHSMLYREKQRENRLKQGLDAVSGPKEWKELLLYMLKMQRATLNLCLDVDSPD